MLGVACVLDVGVVCCSACAVFDACVCGRG